MDKNSVFLSIGIADIMASYVLFTAQQYFSLPAMLVLAGIVAIGFCMVLVPYYCKFEASGAKSKMSLAIMALALISVALIAYESYYDLAFASSSQSTSISGIIFVVAAVAVFTSSLYLIKKKVRIEKRYKSYVLVLIIIAAVSVLLYFMQAYRLYVSHWAGTDELAFNYYASYLFLHGINPYNTTMAPVLAKYHLYPTLELSGRCECYYGYPALSFILPAIVSLFSQGFIYIVILETIILVYSVALLLYRNQNVNSYALLPLAAWFAAFFYLVPAPIDKYLAVSLFLLMAYIYRTRIILSSIFLGLAASTHQLSWIALPFFFIMIYKESGRNAVVRSVLITIGIFLIINGYFIALSPYATLNNMLALFTAKLQFSGPSVMQMLAVFYPTAYWYPAAMIAIILISTLLLFYLYTDTLRSLVVIAPLIVFFMSWRNLSSYATAFMPLLIAMYYFERKDRIKDMIQNKRPIMYAALFAVIAGAMMLVYAHSIYTQSKLLQITQIRATVGRNETTGAYVLTGIDVNVSSNLHEPENVSFFVISRNPDNLGYFGNQEYVPGNYHNTYILNYTLPRLSTDTKLYVFVLSNDYIERIGINTGKG